MSVSHEEDGATAPMASKTTLNEKNLQALGPDRLAALVMELVTGDAARKRQARAALMENAGGDFLAAEVNKRIATIKRSTSRVTWKKRHAFAADLERQRATITDKIAPTDPKGALDLMWRFLDLAGPSYARCDDSSGALGDIFDHACADLEMLTRKAKPDPVVLADQVFALAVEGNGSSQYDRLIGYTAAALGETGIAHLKQRVMAKQAEAQDRKPDRKAMTLQRALRDIADAEGDVDAFIAGYDEKMHSAPAIATEIAVRLLKADRAEEAMVALEKVDAGSRYVPRAYVDAELATLEALDRIEDAQALRWKQFETTLSDPDLRDYLKRLPDFDDVETEERALDHAAKFAKSGDALTFLVNWPSLERAASLVLARRDKWDGNAWWLLPDAAQALAGRYTLAATVLHRAAITATLRGAKAKRYRHAARHLLECESLAPMIEDYEGLPSHDAFVAALRRTHSRKFGFWKHVRLDGDC